MSEKPKRRRLLRRVTIVTLVTLVLLVFLSRTIANALLPAVEVSEVTREQVPMSTRFDGRISFPDRVDLSGAVDYKITAVLVEQGQHVELGDPVLEIDLSDYEAQRDQLELGLMQLEHANEYWLPEAAQEEMDLQIKMQEDLIAGLEENYPADGLLRAPASGVVSAISAKEDRTVPREITLLSISPGEIQAYARFEVSPEHAALYANASMANLEYTPNERYAKVENVKSSIERIEYLEESNTYLFYAPFEESAGLTEGQNVSIYLSDSSPIYDLVVPLGAVRERDGQQYVYTVYESDGLFGKEIHIRENPVTQADKNNFKMAVNGQLSPMEKVVVNTTKPLQDGQRVRVME